MSIRFGRRRRAVGLLEYGLLLGLVGAFALIAVTGLGQRTNSLFDQVADDLAGTASATAADTTPPSVTTISLAGSTLDDLVAGNELVFLLIFSEPVSASATPTVSLALDALSGQSASYMSHKDASSLYFTYILPSDQGSYASLSLTALGAGVADIAGNAALSTLPGFTLSGTVPCVPPVGVIYRYDTPGSYTWIAPCGITAVTVEMWGAGAGGAAGGAGGGGGACELGGATASGGSDAGAGSGEAGASSIIKSNTTLIARGGKSADYGRAGGGGGNAHTTAGSTGSNGRGGFTGGQGSANFIRTGLGIVTVSDNQSNAGLDGQDGCCTGIIGGTGGSGGAGGAAHTSLRDGSTATGAGGVGGGGGAGGDGGGPSGFGTYGGGGGAGGGGAGGGGGGYVYVTNVPSGASLGVDVGAATGSQSATTGGLASGNGGGACAGSDGDGGSGSGAGQNGLVLIIPE